MSTEHDSHITASPFDDLESLRLTPEQAARIDNRTRRQSRSDWLLRVAARVLVSPEWPAAGPYDSDKRTVYQVAFDVADAFVLEAEKRGIKFV